MSLWIGPWKCFAGCRRCCCCGCISGGALIAAILLLLPMSMIDVVPRITIHGNAIIIFFSWCPCHVFISMSTTASSSSSCSTVVLIMMMMTSSTTIAAATRGVVISRPLPTAARRCFLLHPSSFSEKMTTLRSDKELLELLELPLSSSTEALLGRHDKKSVSSLLRGVIFLG